MSTKPPPSQIPSEPLPIFDPPPKPLFERLKPWLTGLLLGLCGVGAVAAFRHYELAQYVDKELLSTWMAPFGPWGAPAVFVGLCIVGTLILVTPFSLMAGVAGLLFGPAWGSFWTIIGCTLGSTLLLFVLRMLGQSWVEKRFNHPRWQNLNQRLATDGFYYILLVRALSILPYTVFNTACALVKVRYRDFFLANLVGLIPAALMYSYGTRLLLDPTTPPAVLLSFAAGAALLMATPFVLKQTRRRRRKQQRNHG